MELDLTVNASNFLRQNSVPFPNYRMQVHFATHIDKVLARIAEVRKLAGSSVFPKDIEDALNAVEWAWRELRKDAVTPAPRKPYVSLPAFAEQHNVHRPDSGLVSNADECDIYIRRIEEVLIMFSDEAAPFILDALRSWRNGWIAIRRKMSIDYGATSEVNARPAEYKARKSAKAEESRMVRIKMQTNKGKK